MTFVYSLLTVLVFILVILFLFYKPAHAETCVLASYYHEEQTTASGEKFNPRALTAAHPTLPFGTMINVRNPRNEKWVRLRINDRGPFIKNRKLDISLKAAEMLGFTGVGMLCIS